MIIPVHILLAGDLSALTHWLGATNDLNNLPQVAQGANCLSSGTSNGGGGGIVGTITGGINSVATSVIPGLGGVEDVIKWCSRFFTWLFELVDDPPKFFRDTLQWVVNLIFPASLQTWLGGAISGSAITTSCGTYANDPVPNIFGSLYDSTKQSAIVLAAAAAACRVLKSMLDQRMSGMVMAADTLPRFFAAAVVTQDLGKLILVSLVNATAHFAGALWSTILSGGGGTALAAAAGSTLVTSVITLLFTGGFTILFALIAIPLLGMFLYVFCLMMVRMVMLGFVFAIAPLCIATAAYDHRNRFFDWWVKLLVATLTLPLILGVSIAVSLRLAIDIARVPFIGPFIAGIVMCCGMWMAGKAVHKLAWENFSHGSPFNAALLGAAVLAKSGSAAIAAGAAPRGGMLDKMTNFMSASSTGLNAQTPSEVGKRGQDSARNAASGSALSTGLAAGRQAASQSGNNPEVAADAGGAAAQKAGGSHEQIAEAAARSAFETGGVTPQQAGVMGGRAAHRAGASALQAGKLSGGMASTLGAGPMDAGKAAGIATAIAGGSDDAVRHATSHAVNAGGGSPAQQMAAAEGASQMAQQMRADAAAGGGTDGSSEDAGEDGSGSGGDSAGGNAGSGGSSSDGGGAPGFGFADSKMSGWGVSAASRNPGLVDAARRLTGMHGASGEAALAAVPGKLNSDQLHRFQQHVGGAYFGADPKHTPALDGEAASGLLGIMNEANPGGGDQTAQVTTASGQAASRPVSSSGLIQAKAGDH